jgi:hypothetical protein
MTLIKSTRFKAVISEINFKGVISESLNNLRGLENAHRLEVKTTIESYLPFFSDKGQMAIIFNNIISNAIKFQHVHEAFPSLVIHIQVDGEKAVISFRDNGVGIPGDSLPKIFDMFYRMPGTKADGAGLGLFMVKDIIKKLKGKIRVVSSPGEGTEFTVELPNRIDPDMLRKLNKLIQNSK